MLRCGEMQKGREALLIFNCFEVRKLNLQEDEPKQIRAYMELSPQPVYEYAVADDLKPVLTNDFVESRANELNGHEPNRMLFMIL